MDSVRIDRWLHAARLYKTRPEAQDACEGGHVKLNGIAVKASHVIRVGDRIEAVAPRGQVILVVLQLADKRVGAEQARGFYEDHSPPPPPKEERFELRDRGAGRPTKADRRALSRLKGNY
jgi:ribosome-associated heat shock protein Hsp15